MIKATTVTEQAERVILDITREDKSAHQLTIEEENGEIFVNVDNNRVFPPIQRYELLSPILKRWVGEHWDSYLFWCPACQRGHNFRVLVPGKANPDVRVPVWEFDGNIFKPTFTPSLRYLSDPKCHVNVTAGRIIFHNDSPKMAGEQVDMVKFPDAT